MISRNLALLGLLALALVLIVCPVQASYDAWPVPNWTLHEVGGVGAPDYFDCTFENAVPLLNGTTTVGCYGDYDLFNWGEYTDVTYVMFNVSPQFCLKTAEYRLFFEIGPGGITNTTTFTNPPCVQNFTSMIDLGFIGDQPEFYVFPHVLVDSLPPIVSFTSNVTGGPVPLPVQFNDTSSGFPTSWLWDFGGEGTSTDQNATHTFTEEKPYYVNLTACNEAGCSYDNKTGYIMAGGVFPISFTCSPRVQIRGRTIVCNSTNATGWDWYSTDSLFTGNLTTENISIKATVPGFRSLNLIGTNESGVHTVPSGPRYIWIPKPPPGISGPTATPIPIPPGLVVLALAFGIALKRGKT